MKALIKIIKFLGIGIYLIALALILVFAIPSTGWRALSVQTGSMVPVIRPGALVLVHSVPATSLHVGDVITYTSKAHPGETITHRIIEINHSGSSIYNIGVKGDANQTSDTPIVPNQIVGRVSQHIPHIGTYVDWLHKPLGVALVVILPALLIIGYEIRLLVKRLTKHEIEKHVNNTPPQPPTAPPAQFSPPRTLDLRQPSQNRQREVKIQLPATRRAFAPHGLAALTLVAGIILSYSGVTRANLSSTATLSNNTIVGAVSPPSVSPTPAPPATNHLVFRQLVFRCSVDNTPTSSSRPRIVLFNPTNQDIVATNWHLEDNSGRIITLPTNTRFGARKMYVIAPLLRSTGLYGLQYSGDHLTLSDGANQVVDGLSWGTDTSQLSPSLANIKVGTRLQRIPARSDTNAATDWRTVERVCTTPGQDDEFGLPAAPSTPDQFILQEQTTISE